MEENRTMAGQKRTDSLTWWIGMAACCAQGICAVLVASGNFSPELSAAVTAAFAGIFAYCNGNNPSLKDVY